MKAGPSTTRRGGARNTGRKLRNNTSGLAAFRFKREGESTYVYAAVGDKRPQRSIKKHGISGALRQLIRVRAKAGYPAPHINTAMRAFRAWSAKHPT